MIGLKKYPLSLQLLMQTDGTVTDLIKLLTKEDIKVVKLSEKTDESTHVLSRQIYLQGVSSHINWLYATSKIYMDNLSDEFVCELKEGNVPIGALWIKYRMETFKQLVDQYEELSSDNASEISLTSSKYLTRIYQVFNQSKLIMEITEKFPIDKYQGLATN